MSIVRNTILIILVFVLCNVINYIIAGDTITLYTTDFVGSGVELEEYKELHWKLSDESVVKVVDYKYIDKYNSYALKLKGLKEGETSITLYGDDINDSHTYEMLYVHKYNRITIGGYYGTMNHMDIVYFEILLILGVALIFMIRKVRRITKETRYSYSQMFYLGVAIFIGASMIRMIICMIPSGGGYFYKGQLYVIYGSIIGLFHSYWLLVLPFAIFLFLSNLILLKKERMRLANLLAIILGVGLITMTLVAFFSYDILDKVMDVHSYIGHHISLSIEYIIEGVLLYFECLMISTIICSRKAHKYVPEFDKDYIIILGCGIRKDGTLTPLLRGRADRAIWFAKKQKEETGKDIKFVASGGQGSDEVIAEGIAIKNYLVEQGIDESDIIVEDKSVNTYENMKYSYELIKKENEDAKIAFSTTGYHVFRSGNVAYQQGIDIVGIGSETKWYFYTNALIREFVANVNSEKKNHIFNMSLIIATIIFLITLSYKLNIM